MSWFFGGGNNNDDKKDTSRSTHDSYSSSSTPFDTAPTTTFGGDLGSSSGLGASPSLGGGSSAGLSSFQEELMAEQQRAVIQAVMFKLTDVAFDQCVPKPSSSLSSSEQSCINATVGKYLETTELIVGRFQGQE
mmetsp:Transcript_2505/g.2611  ORF Transcript_2505/g.2611 Transcript_2505/m.2611 type:complete len:134 (+) Transcript_2505:94-495(+)|eukprot:CAMPEP_0173153080 /NCGR_PEP_ID=MMETSP1105-20130129/12633_1 /TAXON_ID=2985 /ORGANISM="Ochromonas sp., Strain BG-1" /LENGTH=133 /DNA_ID=CAMNT_0014068919 /DNA_START=35 /DNA_END=436 /DNA_ORIENTATION=-